MSRPQQTDYQKMRQLPKYENPPVVEVAISVFFKSLPGFMSGHFGQFWAANADYPITQDQPPLVENIGIELIQLPPLRRVFLLTEDSNYLMQVQPDFFAHNWRKTKPGDGYPSFEHAKRLFLQKWEGFQKFVAAFKLGDLSLTRYEVTYVNHIVEQQSGAFPSAIEKYSPLIKLREVQPKQFLPNAKSLLADLQFDIPNEQGTLRVSFKQGVRDVDKSEVMQVDLSARRNAKPDGSDLLSWLEIAHEWIVCGFTDLTSEEAHKLWKRVQ
jgi:uncharacterized protein (TIGR04255 family)